MTAAPFNDGSEGLWRPVRGPGAWLWWLDRAFERARASGKAEDDTRLRIFFVMALFAAAFATLGLVATKTALFSGLDNAEAGSGRHPGRQG